ncbi:Response regulator receiver domain-containing protein [Bacteroides ovatus]|uniref:Response regulator receiver domain-containing protein n=2 Tax=Bacteroidaceae TaxID=815 RepID=A0A1G6G057_BACOV|nr:response regulator [Bacteroides ovatus]SDB75348.1 Response regulator receiver domain-containing protein [Bacteroides ovatus]
MKPALIYYKENVFSQLDYFQNIRLATSGRTVDGRFYLTYNDLSESYKKEGFTAIFIMNTLSDNAMELQGLQMAHYIRIITRGEGVGKLPIFLIGSENFTELLRLSDYSSILQTPAVELLPYSKEKVKNVIDNIHTYKHLENYEAYLKKTHIPQPNNYLSHHSITSEWSLYQWSKCLNIKPAIENHIERNLYYRYVTSQHPESNDKVTIDYPPYPSESESGKKRILIIDDEADKGWGELYKALFSHYSCIEVNTLKDFDYASDTKETLLQKVKEAIEENRFEPYHLVLLDIRLLQDDFNKQTDFSSFDVIDRLQALNKGIPIIIVTASNKAWNLQYTLNRNVFAYITKESIFDKSCSKEKLEELLKQSVDAISKSHFLQKVAENEKIILDRLNDKTSTISVPIRKRMLYNIKEQIEIAWVMLTNYRFDERYLRYAYLSYYQILELFVDTDSDMYIKIEDKKEIYCEDTKGEYINCSEKLKSCYDKTKKGHLIQITKNNRNEKDLEPSSSYARIGSWMFARTKDWDFITLLELNSTRNNNTHGGSSTSNIDLEKRLLKMMALIINFMNNA